MLDHLTLTSAQPLANPELTIKEIMKIATFRRESADKYHKDVQSFYKGHGNLLIALHQKPRHSNISPIKLQVIPSRFETFSDLQHLISIVDKPERFEIVRIDHTVDIRVPINEVASRLIYPRKRAMYEYKNGVDVSNFYFGNFPEKLCVYDKALQARISAPLTRLELRQYKAKIEYKNFTDIEMYRFYQPFSKLKFIKKKQIPTSLRDSKKLILLHELAEEIGAQRAYKILNKYNNFRRDFGTKLDSKDIFKLNQLYQKNLKNFFVLPSLKTANNATDTS